MVAKFLRFDPATSSRPEPCGLPDLTRRRDRSSASNLHSSPSHTSTPVPRPLSRLFGCNVHSQAAAIVGERVFEGLPSAISRVQTTRLARRDDAVRDTGTVQSETKLLPEI